MLVNGNLLVSAVKLVNFERVTFSFVGLTCRAVARALIGGLNIHIFVLCPTNFFWNKNDFKRN